MGLIWPTWKSCLGPYSPKTFSGIWISLKAFRQMPQTNSWWSPPPLHVFGQKPELEPSALVPPDQCWCFQFGCLWSALSCNKSHRLVQRVFIFSIYSPSIIRVPISSQYYFLYMYAPLWITFENKILKHYHYIFVSYRNIIHKKTPSHGYRNPTINLRRSDNRFRIKRAYWWPWCSTWPTALQWSWTKRPIVVR